MTPARAVPANLQQVLTNIKGDFAQKILTDGHNGMVSMTRSANPVKRLHAHIETLLLAAGVRKADVAFEKSIATLFGDKRQDVVVIPRGKTKPTGESTISIGVKSQLYGIQKNLDNMFSSVRAELLNQHEVHYRMVTGHVHLVAVSEFDTAAAEENIVAYKKFSPRSLSAIIQRYGIISGRKVGAERGMGDTRRDSDGFAERIALVLVDFSTPTPTVFTDIGGLEGAGYLPEDSGLSLDHLTLNDFAEDLLVEHRTRFTGAHRL